MAYIEAQSEKPDIVVFLDGDYSDYPEDLSKLVKPIIKDNIDLVIGARVKTLREPNSMTPQQVFGNWLATFLMKLIYGARFTDLGPFRAIKYQKLLDLHMEDKTYGWTVEMQLKALKQKFKYIEVPVKYKQRIGVSKVSGTIKGSIFAGFIILGWIFKYSIKK
jgi:glycosyltransferase involved in cell wall biosynthesis